MSKKNKRKKKARGPVGVIAQRPLTAALQAQFEAGMAAHERGFLEEAERAYAAVLGQVPTHAESLHMRGMLNLQRGDNDAAVRFLGKASKLAPGEAGILCNYALALERNRDLQGAVVAYEAALAVSDDIVQAHTGLGNVLAALPYSTDQSRARRHYQRAMDLAPSDATAHANLGAECKRQGDQAAAIASFQAAIALDPHLEGARESLGLALLSAGQHREGLRAMRESFGVIEFSRGSTSHRVDGGKV